MIYGWCRAAKGEPCASLASLHVLCAECSSAGGSISGARDASRDAQDAPGDASAGTPVDDAMAADAASVEDAFADTCALASPCDGAIACTADGAACPAGSSCAAGRCVAPAGSCSVSLSVMADASGSTSSILGDGGTETRLEALTKAIGAFIDEPASAGIGFGLGHDAVTPPSDAGTACSPGTQCGSTCCPAGGTCLFGMLCVSPTASCSASNYAKPDVPIGALPGVAAATHVALGTLVSGGQSPEIPALGGALSYARSVATRSNKVAIVFVADGPWNVCPTGDAGSGMPAAVADVAAPFAAATPAVPTYVVGIHGDADASYFDPIAAAGGTGHAYVTSSSAEILAALEAVRDAFKASACP